MTTKLISSTGNISLINLLKLLFNRKLIIIVISFIFSITYSLLNINNNTIYNYGIHFTPNFIFNDYLDKTSLDEITSNLYNIAIIEQSILQFMGDKKQSKIIVDTYIKSVTNQIKTTNNNNIYSYELTYASDSKINSEFFKILIQNSYLYFLENKEKEFIVRKNNNQLSLEMHAQESIIKDKNLTKDLEYKIQILKDDYEFDRINKLARINEAISIAIAAGIDEPTVNAIINFTDIRGTILNKGIPLFHFGTKALINIQNILKSGKEGYKDNFEYLKLISLKSASETNQDLIARNYSAKKTSVELDNFKLVSQINKIKQAKENLFFGDIIESYVSSIDEINSFKWFNFFIIQLAGLIIGVILVILNKAYREYS